MPEENKLTENPVLLVATRTWNTKDNVDWETYRKVFEIHLKRYDILRSHGYGVHILGIKDYELPGYIDAINVLQFMTDFESARPGSVLRVAVGDNKEFLSLLWPADIFQVFRGKVFAAPGLEKLTERILSELNISAAIIPSNLGDGGYSIRDKEIVGVSQAIARDAGLETLEAMGYKTYILPIMTRARSKTISSDALAERMEILQGHIDVEINQAGLNVCVTPEYYREFEREIGAYLNWLKKTTGRTPTKYIIPTEEVAWKAANFRAMHDGKITMLDECNKTANWFEEMLGRGKVITLPYDNIDFYYRGGFRCRSNLIE